jgi:serine/threonine protein kinase
MASQRSLALNKLVHDNETLSEVEVATVVAPLLERLRVLHHAGEAHGNVSLATVAIRVVEPADGTIYLLDPACRNEPSHRPCMGCQKIDEGATSAADVWSVGIIALQLLLGRPCRQGCHSSIVEKRTGEMPVLPRGTSLECIDFLSDCLAPRPADRPSAADLLTYDFLRTIAPPRVPKSEDTTDSLSDSLSNMLLISQEDKQQEQACRPSVVPSLKAKGRVCFTVASHTERCHRCRCQCSTSHQLGTVHQPSARQPTAQHPTPAAPMPPLPSDASVKLLTSHSPKLTPNTSGSAASTKRKLGRRDVPLAHPKRQCSGLGQYLSPAIHPWPTATVATTLMYLPPLVLAVLEE